MLASVPVGLAAPNDIIGTPGETAKVNAARRQYGAAVREAFAHHQALLAARPSAVVIRHWPQRDADNTWHTTPTTPGTRGLPHYAVPTASAKTTGHPTAIASMADTRMNAPVRYELWT